MDEIVTVETSGIPDATLRGRLGKSLRRVHRGVYTPNMTDPLEAVVARNWKQLTGILLPGAVVTDRSARTGRPQDGLLFVSVPTTRTRDVQLPGLTIIPRGGAPAEPDDLQLAPGVHLARPSRALVENLRPSRSVKGRPARTLGEAGVGDWLAHLAATTTDTAFRRVRADAVDWAHSHGYDAEGERVNELAGAAAGTRNVPTASPLLTARQAGRGYDERRVAQFDELAVALTAEQPVIRSIAPGYAEARGLTLPFWESYFSNFIEGTEFGVDEAIEIVYEGAVPDDRPADAHDVLSLYQIAHDPLRRARVATTPDEFLDILRDNHAEVMRERPEKRPGVFKHIRNFMGATAFVEPDLVEGTLIEGWHRIQTLADPFQRAVLAMYVVTEVHPFLDGNGRVARLAMNAELSAAAQHRIVIPTGLRDDYLSALRAMTHNNRHDPLFSVLTWAQQYTSQIDFSDLTTAETMLRATNAFVTPAERDDGAPRLVLPSTLGFTEPVVSDEQLTRARRRAERSDSAVSVEPYRRGDGTPVEGHRRARPGR